jgi:hypothetical protein
MSVLKDQLEKEIKFSIEENFETEAKFEKQLEASMRVDDAMFNVGYIEGIKYALEFIELDEQLAYLKRMK